MLSFLSVSNYSVIEKVEIDLSAGLNIITGETGAGKSVLIGAIKLLLGERFSKSMQRDENKKVRVEGIFNGDFSHLPTSLREDFEISNEILVRREIDTSGKNKIYINGILATLKQLKSITSECIDIHGQHEHQKLFDNKRHLEYIDSLIDAQKLADYSEKFQIYSEKKSKLKKLKEDFSTILREKDIYEFQINEIDEMDVDFEQESKLDEKIKYLSHIEKINENISFSLSLLSESEFNICDSLSNVIGRLNEISTFSKEIESVCNRLEEVNYEIIDCKEIISDMLSSSDSDTTELDKLMSRKYKLDKLCKKYGGSLQALIEYRNQIKDKLDNLFINEEEIDNLSKQIDELHNELIILMNDINKDRKTVAKDFSKKIVKALSELDLKNTIFNVKFEFSNEPDVNAGANAEFYISTNIGFEPAPLVNVASGGEISRVMLGLKEILNNADFVSTMIFDEIDTGISGKTAEMVAQKLKKLSNNKQLLVITHLPVVASKGNSHFHIFKETSNEKTVTKIKQLDENERRQIIATMIAGKISDSSIANATELLTK